MSLHVTILFLRRDGEVLLAMKKRGFGQGKWNGVGGKLEPNESALQAAIRECQEEIGVTPHSLRKLCELDFYLADDPTFNNYAHVYETTDWRGEPHETDEMRPQWFALDAIPYDAMWGDDKLWLPLALGGKRLKGKLVLDTQETVIQSTLKEITSDKEFSA